MCKHVKSGEYHVLLFVYTHSPTRCVSYNLGVLQLFIFFFHFFFFFSFLARNLKLVSIFAIFVDQNYIGNGISYSDWEGPQKNRWAEHPAKPNLFLNSSNGLQT